MNNIKYIYNVKQANFFIYNGARCIGTGLNKNSKQYYWEFNYDELQPLYPVWNEWKLK